MNEHLDVEPDLDELQGEDPKLPPLNVNVEGPAQVHILPSQVGVANKISSASGSDPVQLLGEDLRRRRITIISIDENIYVGSKDRCADGQTALWPKLVPLLLEHTEQIYVRAAANATTVTYISENWAD